MTTHALELPCRVCGRANNATSNATPGHGQPPGDGHATVCWGCSCVSIFVGTPPTELREPTPQEWAELRRDPSIAALQQVRPVSRTPHDALRRAGLLR
ncbi:hypothetical protein [Nocardioides marmoraquaticus]